MYESITKFLPKLEEIKGYRKSEKNNHGKSFVLYDKTISDLCDSVVQFGKIHPEYELDRYEEILHGIGIENAELNLYLLDTKILMALLMAMVESTEHMIDYCRSGDIQFLLHLLKEADNNDSETLRALKEIRLVSENNAFWPDGDEESRWKLTISKKGLVHLTKYVSVGVDKYKIVGKEKIAVELDAVETIIDMVGMWFENYEKENFIICNCPMWHLTLINDDGKHFVIHGPMKESVLPDLSDFIREELGRKDLKLFDGNPGQVES